MYLHVCLRYLLNLQYIDDFLVVGYGKNRVCKDARALCGTLREAGAIISIKSVLEPVPEIPWFGKLLVFSEHNAGFFRMVRVGLPWLASG